MLKNKLFFSNLNIKILLIGYRAFLEALKEYENIACATVMHGKVQSSGPAARVFIVGTAENCLGISLNII
jgi:hypothetical protein